MLMPWLVELCRREIRSDAAGMVKMFSSLVFPSIVPARASILTKKEDGMMGDHLFGDDYRFSRDRTTIQELRDRITELEEENARLRNERDDPDGSRRAKLCHLSPHAEEAVRSLPEDVLQGE